MSRLAAPRSLKEPVSWRFSSFRNTCAPVIAESVAEYAQGVTWTMPASRARAARTSSRVTMAVRPREAHAGPAGLAARRPDALSGSERGDGAGRRTPAHRHERRRMGEGHAALPVEQDESSLAPAFLDEDVDGDLSRVGRIIHGLQDLDRPPRERDPDRGLAVAGAGDAGHRAVRVRAAADQGRVPDAPWGLAGAAARRGAGGDRAETIERDRSDRAGLERLELPPLAICHEVARITERDAERLRLL